MCRDKLRKSDYNKIYNEQRKRQQQVYLIFTFSIFSTINLGFSQSINILLRDHKFSVFVVELQSTLSAEINNYTVGFGPQIYSEITESKLKARKLLD